MSTIVLKKITTVENFPQKLLLNGIKWENGDAWLLNIYLLYSVAFIAKLNFRIHFHS